MDLGDASVVLVRTFLVVTMFAIGLRVGRRVAAGPVGHTEADRGRSVRVAGLAAVNLLVVPAFALALCLAVGLPSLVAFGIVAVAVAPAGSLGPKLVELARGDLAAGVVATFALSAVATLSVVPSLAVAAGVLGASASITPPDAALVVSGLVIFQLAPMLAGAWVARRRPSLARRLVDPATRASTILILPLIAVVIADSGGAMATIGPAAILVMVAIATASLALGWIAGGRRPTMQRATALVTAQRSGALALLVAGGPGRQLETATIVAFALILLVVNVGCAVWLGRGALDARTATGEATVAT